MWCPVPWFVKIQNGCEILAFRGCSRFCYCESAKLQQDSTEFNKQAANISTSFNTLWHLVRDQEAGGSNPLAPTIIFNHVTSGLFTFSCRREVNQGH
jgi:hypothetical protein